MRAPKTPPLALDRVLLIVCSRDTSRSETVSDICFTQNSSNATRNNSYRYQLCIALNGQNFQETLAAGQISNKEIRCHTTGVQKLVAWCRWTR